ncbi:type VI secretion system protein VasI [Devosia crocina]|uniref:Type VI secretion system protein VasI n=1 Tax=Devosia crocina TaxID=429728 RepID=A0A1I7NNK0_9HYPH|nr:hypothetical protein [Devosia crocina]SFV36215.1 type VI secretion system protein VasI [Devosia crocina]
MNKAKALAALALTCMTMVIPAMGQTGGQCAAIGSDTERLACYDRVFRDGAAASEALSVSFESEQLIPARPSGRAPATMTISCSAGTLGVAFAYAGNTMSALGRDAGITWQVDLQAARSRTLPVNDTNTALLLDNTPDSLDFLGMLVGGNNLTTRVTPVNSRSLSVRFNLAGVLEAVEPVRAACS